MYFYTKIGISTANECGAQPNPFIYGRVLTASDPACARTEYETAILEAVRDSGRLALCGDRRLGKSSLIERTLGINDTPVLRWDFHKLLSIEDLIRRCAEGFDSFVRNLSPIACRVTPWCAATVQPVHR